MAVITSDGIVGKVLMVYPSVSQVLMINDQSSGVGAMLEKTRLQGVVRGTPNGEVTLERVMSDEQVPVGETVLTSGGDQIFPKGLPVGTVSNVGPGKDMFLKIKMKPAADLSKLEEVLVLTEKQESEPAAETGVRVRAADILAQRLPSVPDKPAVDAKAAAGTAETGAKPVHARHPPNPRVCSRNHTAARIHRAGNAAAVPAAGQSQSTRESTNPPSKATKSVTPAGNGSAAPTEWNSGQARSVQPTKVAPVAAPKSKHRPQRTSTRTLPSAPPANRSRRPARIVPNSVPITYTSASRLRSTGSAFR